MQREGEDETGLYKGKVGVVVGRAVLMQVEGMRRTVLEQVLVFVGMLEWWNDGIVERWNGGKVEWWNGGMVEWWNGGMVDWWIGGMVEWWNCGIVDWWNGEW